MGRLVLDAGPLPLVVSLALNCVLGSFWISAPKALPPTLPVPGAACGVEACLDRVESNAVALAGLRIVLAVVLTLVIGFGVCLLLGRAPRRACLALAGPADLPAPSAPPGISPIAHSVRTLDSLSDAELATYVPRKRR